MTRLLKDLHTGVGQTEFELDQSELAAIGRVTAHWAYLEHGIYAVSLALAASLNVTLPDGAAKSSFTRRLNALSSLIKEITDEAERKRLQRLVGRIANAEQDRHKLTHGMWDYDPANPEKLRASSFRPGYEFEKRYDATSLHALADRIGQISFALEYPEGWDAAFAELLAECTDEHGVVRYASTSRELARQLAASRSENGEK